MKYRLLGKTGLLVSEIGFGTWGIGGATDDGPNSYGDTNDKESIKSLQRAFDLGVTFYDTANIYGYGHSEELLGQAFKGMRKKIIIASKVGFKKHQGPHCLKGAYIRAELEKTLARLKTDYLDIYQLHSPPMGLLEKNYEAIPTMQNLKKEGKILAYGISTKNPIEAVVAIKNFDAEVVQVNFSMIDQRAEESGLFNLAQKECIGIIARTPLAFGFLSGNINNLNFTRKDHRSSWSKNQLNRWQKSPTLFSLINQEPRRTKAQFALQFCLSIKVISVVIPGMIHSIEVEENAAASEMKGLTDAELLSIRRVYKENIFFEKKI